MGKKRPLKRPGIYHDPVGGEMWELTEDRKWICFSKDSWDNVPPNMTWICETAK